jgi:hypothetical protein
MTEKKWRRSRARWWLALLAIALSGGAAKWRIGCSSRQPDWKEEALAGFELNPRSAWEAAPPTGPSSALGVPQRITLHHSGAGIYRRTDWQEVKESLRAIQRHHQEKRGWTDIAYHLIIDPAGRLWEGRPLVHQGAHAGSSRLNERNVGILLLGNFNLQEPTTEQLAVLRDLLESLRRACGVPFSRVYGHKEIREAGGLATTECPGLHLDRWLVELRRRAATGYAAGAE